MKTKFIRLQIIAQMSDDEEEEKQAVGFSEGPKKKKRKRKAPAAVTSVLLPIDTITSIIKTDDETVIIDTLDKTMRAIADFDTLSKKLKAI